MKAAPPELLAMMGPPKPPAGSKSATPVGPRPLVPSKAVTPVGPRSRSPAPRASGFNKVPEPAAPPVKRPPVAPPAAKAQAACPPPVRYSPTAVPVPYNLEGQGTAVEQALAEESVAWIQYVLV